MTSETWTKASSTVCRYFASDSLAAASAARLSALSEPPWKIGAVRPAPRLQPLASKENSLAGDRAVWVRAARRLMLGYRSAVAAPISAGGGGGAGPAARGAGPRGPRGGGGAAGDFRGGGGPAGAEAGAAHAGGGGAARRAT